MGMSPADEGLHEHNQKGRDDKEGQQAITLAVRVTPMPPCLNTGQSQHRKQQYAKDTELAAEKFQHLAKIEEIALPVGIGGCVLDGRKIMRRIPENVRREDCGQDDGRQNSPRRQKGPPDGRINDNRQSGRKQKIYGGILRQKCQSQQYSKARSTEPAVRLITQPQQHVKRSGPERQQQRVSRDNAG